MSKISNFLAFFLLFTLSSCLSIKNFDSYQKVPMSESEFLPTKSQLKGKVSKVVVFPFDVGDNKIAKDADVIKVAITSVENILTENDFVCVKSNWDDKAKNIAEIAKELNIGLDSFVFIDDNPRERERVKTELPMV